ncbi:aromatic amino acid ammonia-lyase [Arthrobacter castelli]|uniref:aromatic amino acid ammonia-lyase n=1 Tax=Arthrobacter castelli TaxID=271431 RepID=UPI0006868921|nr:aromatic amino acid ammonia-lyase [Arthrobacter castelli]
MDAVIISDKPMTLDELRAAVAGAAVSLAPEARGRIDRSHAVVKDALDAGEPVYGLNTDVGHGKDTAVPPHERQRRQEALVMTHGGAYGPPLPTEVVRAALVVRINGMARGGSGASPDAVDALVGLLNAGVHPVVPGTGSVGAGDLAPMACIAQVAIGEGWAEYDGETLPGAEALRRASLGALQLQGRDGLALVAANGISLGHAALLIGRIARVVEAADVAMAASMEAARANPSIVQAPVGSAKPYPGQRACAEHLRDLLDGSFLHQPDGPRSVQDPISFRVVPQVHGALRDHIDATISTLEAELNAMCDNPLVDVDSGRLISNGNFHPIMPALALDSLRVALAHAGQLSDRRLNHLWSAAMQPGSGDEQATRVPGLGDSPGMQLRYAASAAFTELRLLAAPATLDSSVLDLGVEDHATGAPLAAAKTAAALELLEDILAIELLLAADVQALDPAHGPSAGTAAALSLAREAADGAGSAAGTHRRLRERFPADAPGG